MRNGQGPLQLMFGGRFEGVLPFVIFTLDEEPDRAVPDEAAITKPC